MASSETDGWRYWQWRAGTPMPGRLQSDSAITRPPECDQACGYTHTHTHTTTHTHTSKQIRSKLTNLFTVEVLLISPRPVARARSLPARRRQLHHGSSQPPPPRPATPPSRPRPLDRRRRGTEKLSVKLGEGAPMGDAGNGLDTGRRSSRKLGKTR